MFKFLNYVTDKIVRVVLISISTYVKVCVNYMCVCEGEKGSFLYIIKHHLVAKTWTRSVDFILLFTVFICLASVSLCVLVIFLL